MSRRRERRSGSSDRELEDLKYRYYRELRDEKVRIRVSGAHLICPYCQDVGRREYDMVNLERHASRIGRDSKSASFRDKARHLGLLEYLDWKGHKVGKSYQSRKRSPEHVASYEDDKCKSVKTARGTIEPVDSAAGTMEPVDMVTEPGEIVVEKGYVAGDVGLDIEPGEVIPGSAKIGVVNKDTSEKSRRRSFQQNQSRSLAPVQPYAHKKNDDDDLLVWPWMAVIANIPVERKSEKYVGEGGRRLKEQWVTEGYNPKKVHPLWNFQGHSGYVIVEFNKDWEGFKNAIAFEKSFELSKHGKRDWHARGPKGDKLYGWLARGEEYRSAGLIGKHLQKNGDLKTVSDIQSEDTRKNTKLVSNLADALETKSKKCEEIKKNISKTEVCMGNVIMQKEEMVQRYNEEVKMLQDNASDQLRQISESHDISRMQLEARREELKLREKELNQRQSLNDKEKNKFYNQKKMNEMAIMEQMKADERMMKLAEDQRVKMERLRKKTIELEKQLDQKHALELQIQQMRGAVEVMKHMGDKGNMEEKKKLEAIVEELKEKEEELDYTQSFTEHLIIKERNVNDELQEARKELINNLKVTRANICVKRMGDLDAKPFSTATKGKYPGEDEAEKAMELCSLWDDHLRDPSWHPYKMVAVGETHKEVLDENDEKLIELKTDLGQEVYEAVVKSLNEMNEYNPSGRYPMPELWNTNQNRKASLKEGIEHTVKQWKLFKGKRRRN